VWDIMVIKRMATSDIYLPHSYDEMIRLVSPEAATRLEPGREYGIRWHNRLRIANRTVSEPDGNGGRRYRKRSTTTLRPKEEWIAVPAPTHLPRSLVEQARQDSRRFRAPRGSTWRGSMGA